MAFAAAVVVVCGSEGDRRAFVAVLPNDLLGNGVISVRKLAGESQLWRWEGPPGVPTFASPPSSSDKVGVAIRLTSKTKLDTVLRLADTREWILGSALWPWPSDVLEADLKYVLDRLPGMP